MILFSCMDALERFPLKSYFPWNLTKNKNKKKTKKKTEGLFPLTLKMPRKPASENVVCLCRLLNILANFSNLFLHTGKHVEPDQTASRAV